MVQFNLLPDVKLEYIKTQRTKYLVTFISTLAGVISIGLLLLLMFIVYIVQPRLNDDKTAKIADANKQLQAISNVDTILTVQSQLRRLTDLHVNEPVTSRLFTYLQTTTPSDVSLDKLQLDQTATTLIVGGSAPSLESVRVYANALKGAKYVIKGASESKKAFSEVVLTSFARTDKGATFTIGMKFDPALFVYDNTVTMNIDTASSDGANGSNPFNGGGN